jgi:hypothetical protein
VIEVNELRGVYWLRSGDGGRTWSDPAQILDAAAVRLAGGGPTRRWPSQPMAVVHVVFEQASLPGTWSTRGLFYTHAYPSPEDGLTFDLVLPVGPAGARDPQLVDAGGTLHLVYQGVMGLETRRLDLFEPEVGWLAVEYLAGWQYSIAGPMPFALAADAQNAHLLGPLTDAPGLRYSAWLGEARTGWTNPPETVDLTPPIVEPLPQAEEIPEDEGQAVPQTPIEPEEYEPPVHMAAAARFNGGWLAAAWAGPSESGLGLHLSIRRVPETSPGDLPPIPPTRTLTPTVTPTPEPPPATPTPELNLPAPEPALPINPLYLAGGLSAFVVLWVLGFYLIVKNRKR